MLKFKKELLYIILLFTFMLAMPVQAQAATKISKNSVTLTAGKSITLKISGTQQKVKWSSNKKAVATVSQKGKVTAKKAGTAKITAKAGPKTFTCKVTVKKRISGATSSSSGGASNGSGGTSNVSGGAAATHGSSNSSYVWLSVTGEKYHRIPNCGRMNPSKAQKITLKEAQARGFYACNKCF